LVTSPNADQFLKFLHC